MCIANMNRHIYIIKGSSNLLNAYYVPDTVLNTVISSISNPHMNPMIRCLQYFAKMVTTFFITYILLELAVSPSRHEISFPCP